MTVPFFIAAGIAVVLAVLLVLSVVRKRRSNGTLYFVRQQSNQSPFVYVEFNEDPKFYVNRKHVTFKTKVVENVGDLD